MVFASAIESTPKSMSLQKRSGDVAVLAQRK
jgi:hypothetical protein